MAKQQLGAWIKQTREAQKLSVRQCSKAAGIAHTTWYDLEDDKHPPSVNTQLGVARALNLRDDWYDEFLAGRTPRPARKVSRRDDDALRRVTELEERVTRLAVTLNERMDAFGRDLDEFRRADRSGSS